jgi:hypothetical protein
MGYEVGPDDMENQQFRPYWDKKTAPPCARFLLPADTDPQKYFLQWNTR